MTVPELSIHISRLGFGWRQSPKNRYFIRITCPGNAYPLKHHFYVVKLGCTGVFFLILTLKHIDCGYSIKPPRTTASWRGGPNVNLIKTRYTSTHVMLTLEFYKIGSNLYPQYMFWSTKKRKLSAFFLLKLLYFTVEKLLYIA